MSSHHVIRENQEPALIISSEAEFDHDTIGQLLEWSPFVLVVGKQIDLVLAMGIKVDAWLMTNKTNNDLICQYGIEIICLEKTEVNLLETAIDYLIEKGFEAVNIIGAEIAEINLLTISSKSNLIKIILIDNDFKLFYLEKRYHKWLPKESTVALIPIFEALNVTTLGAALDLKNEILVETKLFNIKEDGFFTVSYESGNLFINEKWQ